MGGSTPVPDLVLEDGGIFLVTKSPSTWNGPRFFVDGWLPFFFSFLNLIKGKLSHNEFLFISKTRILLENFLLS